jgi:hypothetical protein
VILWLAQSDAESGEGITQVISKLSVSHQQANQQANRRAELEDGFIMSEPITFEMTVQYPIEWRSL